MGLTVKVGTDDGYSRSTWAVGSAVVGLLSANGGEKTGLWMEDEPARALVFLDMVG